MSKTKKSDPASEFVINLFLILATITTVLAPLAYVFNQLVYGFKRDGTDTALSHRNTIILITVPIVLWMGYILLINQQNMSRTASTRKKINGPPKF